MCCTTCEQLVIKPALPTRETDPVFGGELSAEEREALAPENPGPSAAVHRAGADRFVHGAGAVQWRSPVAAVRRARLPGCRRGLLHGHARRAHPGHRLARFADRVVAARRRQQRHVDSGRGAGEPGQPAAARGGARWRSAAAAATCPAAWPTICSGWAATPACRVGGAAGPLRVQSAVGSQLDGKPAGDARS